MRPRDPWKREWESELDGNDWKGVGMGQFPLKGKKKHIAQ
jgi:hypothetical protein